jgi:riboflavin kinase / FMN adenylyltransferase
MIFKSRQIKGAGRGKGMGYPTVNLIIPSDLVLDYGVHAAWVEIADRIYKGALHYGPTPTFNQKEETLEVYLLDVTDDNFPHTEGEEISVDIVEYLREIQLFSDADILVEQIGRDVERVRTILG